MKKQICLFTIALAAVISFPFVGSASPLKSGLSGIINTPTGTVRGMGRFSLGAQYDEKDKVIGGNVVVLPSLEVAYSHITPSKGEDLNMISAKYGLLPETIGTPGVSIGVEDITNERDRSGFVALSKEAVLGFRVHAGIGTDRLKKGFVALEKNFKLSSSNYNVGLQLEYDGYDFNYGALLPLGKALKANIGSRSKDFFAGVNYTF